MSQIPALQTRARSYFDEGELAFGDEIERDDCPYPWDSSAAANWIAGWDSAEYENAQLVEGEARDRRLDDPRHGQP